MYTYNIGICTDAEADGTGSGFGVLQRKIKDSSFKIVIGKYTNASIMDGRTYILFLLLFSTV